VVRVSDFGSKGSGFDPRVVPKSECTSVNIYLINLCLMLYYVFDCCFSFYNCYVVALSKPCAAIWQHVYYCAKLRMLCCVHMMICVLLYALSCMAGIV